MDAQAYSFTVEWHDRQADLIREYQLTAFLSKNSPLEVAMYDTKANRSFLKRSEMPHLQLGDFRIGSIVTIHSRQLKVTGYRDIRTEQTLGDLHAGVYLMTAPAVFPKVGELLEKVESTGLRLGKLRLVNNNGPSFALEFVGNNSVATWNSLKGSIAPNTVSEISEPQLQALFNRSQFPCTAAFDNCTLVVVRPHAVRDGGVGMVLKEILGAGLEVSAAEMFQLDRVHATEFLEVYKGVLPYYSDLVDCMCAGPCVAFEVRGPEGLIEQVRELAGPHDVDTARYLRPNSFRARLGKDNAQNGVHTTDLEEDGEREVAYFFETLLKA
mmetsp:Transcript_6914/g.15758  ORF Transcript_6914/g.15758 Transcript_6914/m.15758 type:complete len:326 (+) Transcript_6914:132-1109(+)